MSNNDFAQLRTLDDIARHKKALQRQVAHQERTLGNDWQRIKRSWQPQSSISSILGFIRPSLNVVGMFGLGLKLAKLILTLRRLK